ncbi:hypothetical protein CDAR_555491 [Caerostris darwini]|uniref:Uncharacterized protein n=1 Tax=Caerostris darwini TaxID=1538125 RepID=A0AAV4QYN5_9ARAC|nr:hypothetical protein CDAR_555491 [Caerostris darwini]
MVQLPWTNCTGSSAATYAPFSPILIIPCPTVPPIALKRSGGWISWRGVEMGVGQEIIVKSVFFPRRPLVLMCLYSWRTFLYWTGGKRSSPVSEMLSTEVFVKALMNE